MHFLSDNFMLIKFLEFYLNIRLYLLIISSYLKFNTMNVEYKFYIGEQDRTIYL